MLNIICDENIAFAGEAFSRFGRVKLLNGRQIDHNAVKDADVIIVRSITNVDSTLLEGTKVKFVGTATIGTDHIDLNYLEEKGITFADAKGCNAYSVAEYVFTALLNVCVRKNISIKGKSIAVIGAGNVGSRVIKFAVALGLQILKNDPPKERAGEGSNFVSLDDALTADIVTLHVPLTYEGTDKTFHLLNEKNLSKLKKGAILINTSRGAVIDNRALIKAAAEKKVNLILDVWEGEPQINIDLLNKVLIGTPHVAGYSLEGKVNGTKMIFEALCKFTSEKMSWEPSLPSIDNDKIRPVQNGSFEEKLYSLFKAVYNIEGDDFRMRKMIGLNEDERGTYFDKLRKEYPLRREFNNYKVLLRKSETDLTALLQAFRFKMEPED